MEEKNMKRVIIGGIAALGAVVALALVFAAPRAASGPQSKNGDVQRVLLSGSLSQSFDSVEGLAGEADLVVIGRILDSATIERQSNPRVDLTFLQTVYEIQIDEVVAGRAPDSTIQVAQMGGFLGGVQQEFESDPLFESGQAYLLFLKYAPDSKVYFTVAAHQGRFVVDDDATVSSLSVAYPDRRIDDVRTEEMPLSAFKTLVQ
jgi:hypothetical protein